MNRSICALMLLSGCACAQDSIDRTFDAVCVVESGGNSLAFNASEDARGIAQIRAESHNPLTVNGLKRFALPSR